MPYKDPEKARARKAANYAAHREEERTRSAVYRAAHREEERSRKAAYYAAHRQELCAYSAAYRLAHLEQEQANHAAYRAAHTEEERARAAAYRADHLEELRAYGRAYYAEHAEECRAYQRAYGKAHPEYGPANSKRHRALKAGACLNDFTPAQWRAMLEHYGHCCVYCGRKMQRLTQDHLTPLSKGGSHTLSNIVPACRSCNSRKRSGPVLKPVQPLLL